MSTRLEFVDNLLNRVTMYRLVLYYLIFLLSVGVVFAFVGVLAYDPYALLFSIGFLIAVCAGTNWIFSKAFGVPANTESAYISALILALIITPIQSTHDLWFLGWAGVLAMASKYIVAINKRHIFNPVAFAVALTYFVINQDASWWVGNAPMLPFVLGGGILLVRKIQRLDLVASFLFTALVTILPLSLLSGDDIAATLLRTLLYSPLLFFAFVILTEPLTTPPTKTWRMVYGALVGFLFLPQVHFGAFYITPEIAILFGNVLSFLVSPKTTLVLQLKRKVQLAPDIYDFVFAPARKFAFTPGQYMEWTLGYPDPDSRGNRRYFTLASAPTEDYVRIGVKFYETSSTFKQALLDMDQNTEIVAAHLAGDFVLPKDPKQKCVLIAGGIGITPFRSMLKHLLDTHQTRPLVLFYANRTVNDIVYVDVLERARQELGIKIIYTVTDTRNVPASWQGRTGYITPQMIRAEVPDYANCIFYISGPLKMVDSFKEILAQLHVSASHSKTDFFAGLA
jgi:ferredoxin-NADP reductase